MAGAGRSSNHSRSKTCNANRARNELDFCEWQIRESRSLENHRRNRQSGKSARTRLFLHKFLAKQTLADPVQKLAHHFAEGFDAADTYRISAHSLLRAQYAANCSSANRLFIAYSRNVDWQKRIITWN
jgi:hypothetical protein